MQGSGSGRKCGHHHCERADSTTDLAGGQSIFVDLKHMGTTGFSGLNKAEKKGAAILRDPLRVLKADFKVQKLSRILKRNTRS